MSTVADEILNIRNRAWATSGARYNAARRLRTRSKLSLATISLISAIGVAIPLIISHPDFAAKSSVLGLYAAILSIFTLVVAVIEGAAGYDAKADSLYRNAEELNAFRMRVAISLSDPTLQTTALLQEITTEYERIRSTCPINHENIDFQLHKSQHPLDFNLNPSLFRSALISGWWGLYSTWWLALVSIISVLILFFVIKT